MVVKIQKVGNSVMVVIPSPMVKDLGLVPGEEMSVEREKRNRVLKFKAIKRKKYKLEDFIGSISIPNFNFKKTEKTIEVEYGR